MTPRRKPIPNPIARPSEPRALAPVRARAALPTVAALLALGAFGCEKSEDIARDVTIATIVRTAEPRSTEVTTVKAEGDPSQPLPGMGALEDPPPPPPAPPPTVVTPPKHPYPVKGGMKAVHPVPSTPPAPGGLKAVSPPPPPIHPTPKAPKLSGDVAAVVPETT